MDREKAMLIAGTIFTLIFVKLAADALRAVSPEYDEKNHQLLLLATVTAIAAILSVIGHK